jgi:hypothetical protein
MSGGSAKKNPPRAARGNANRYDPATEAAKPQWAGTKSGTATEYEEYTRSTTSATGTSSGCKTMTTLLLPLSPSLRGSAPCSLTTATTTTMTMASVLLRLPLHPVRLVL